MKTSPGMILHQFPLEATIGHTPASAVVLNLKFERFLGLYSPNVQQVSELEAHVTPAYESRSAFWIDRQPTRVATNRPLNLAPSASTRSTHLALVALEFPKGSEF